MYIFVIFLLFCDSVVDCGAPMNVIGATLMSTTYNTTYGSQVYYECIEGYYQVPDASQTAFYSECLNSTSWSDPQSGCQGGNIQIHFPFLLRYNLIHPVVTLRIIIVLLAHEHKFRRFFSVYIVVIDCGPPDNATNAYIIGELIIIGGKCKSISQYISSN